MRHQSWRLNGRLYIADSGPDFYRGATIKFAAGEIML
jgi:hypothetical protein